MTASSNRARRRPLSKSYLAVAYAAALTTSLCSAPACAQATAEESMAGVGMKTVAVVAINSYDDLMGDINYVGGLFGRPETGQMIEGMVAMVTQGRGIVGLDKSRPLGVIVEADGDSVTPVGCLPIDDLDSVLEILQAFDIAPADAGDGITELQLPNQTLYLKPQGPWVFLADDPEALSNTPDDPGPALMALVAEYDLGAKTMIQNVPEEAREELIDAMREGMEAGLEQRPDESDEQYELRAELAEVQVEQITEMIQGVDELTVGLNIDAEGQVTRLDLAVTTLPDTFLSTAFQSYDNLETRQRGFHREGGAMSMIAAGNNPPEMIVQQRAQLEAMVGMFRKQIDQAIDDDEELGLSAEQRETLKSAGGDLIDAYESIVYAGKSDLGGSIDFVDGELSLIAGLTMEQPEKVESALKKLVEVLESKPDFPGVEWDADTHGEVTMHRLPIPLPPQAEIAAPLLGDTVEVTFGFGPQAIYFAVGPQAAADLKTAIDESAAKVGPLELPVEFIISLQKFLKAARPYADEDAAPMLDQLIASLDGMPEGSDQITIRVIRIEEGALFRYEISEGVLKAIGAAAAAAQAQAAGQF